jgi:steroid delta-isomerase-like uncharacterized protein
MPASATAILDRWVTLFNAGEIDAMRELLDVDFVDLSPFPGQPDGPDGFLWKMRLVLEGLPDARYRIERQVVDGDRVANQYVVSGTHNGDLFGITATGNKVSFVAVDFLRIHDSRITENWALSDTPTLMAQLGVQA